jgi:hypothetical protein
MAVAGWRERVGGLFARPAVPAAVAVLAGLVLAFGEVQTRPMRAQVERERKKQVERESAVHKALHQYTETMRLDNAAELRGWEKRLIQGDAQMQGVMEQIAGWMRTAGWKGQLVPRLAEPVAAEVPQLQRVRLEVELTCPRDVSERLPDSDQTRLFRLLRQISEIPAPHVLRMLEVEQNAAGELRARMELDFFRLKADG